MRKSPHLALIYAIAIAVSTLPAVRADVVRSLSAEIEEEVRAIEGSADALTVVTASRSIPAAEIKEIRFPGAERAPRPTAARAFLAAGDELGGKVAGGAAEGLVFATASLGQVSLKLEALRAIAFTGDEAELRRFRYEILPLEAKKDLIVLRSWGRIEGAVEAIDRSGVVVDSRELGKVTLDLEKVLGLRLAALGKRPAPGGLVARLELADGSVVLGKLASYREGVFRLETAFRTPLELRLEEVRSLSFEGGRIVYVSDLRPVEVEERASLIAVVFPYREDLNVMGNPIRLDGKSYRKGLGVHAYARLVYSLDGQYSRFRAIVGIDDEARKSREAEGAVRFQVLVDGRPALGADGLLRTGRDAGVPVDVDVTGARSIALIAGFGPGDCPDTLARGVFADAYLVKQ